MAKILIDPITRIEGHLSIEIDVQNGKVVDAKSKGDMFRGFETILKGRNPVDANQITQRICGVCPISHGIASSKCLEGAFGIKPNDNGRIQRNLILAANYLQSHIIHFYHLSALDFVDITQVLSYKGSDAGILHLQGWVKNDLAAKKGKDDEITIGSPFLPRFGGLSGNGMYLKDHDANIDAIAGYVKALDIRMKAHMMAAIFGGRLPHAIALVPGGVTQVPERSAIRKYRKLLKEIEKFVNNEYKNHLMAVAASFQEYFKLGAFSKFLSYGLIDLDGDGKSFFMERGVVDNLKLESFDPSHIREQVGYARYSSRSDLHPYEGATDPQPDKARAYTWLKAPRYMGKPMETGPLARVIVAHLSGNSDITRELRELLKVPDEAIPGLAVSVLGRHASRYIECKLICKKAGAWLDQLETGAPPRSHYSIPDEGHGEGLVEAPRGALGHWIKVKNKVIDNYQCVVPTTWYCSPRDDRGNKGPVEEALIGTPIADPENPIEAARVVRSFDPCIACAVHVAEGDRAISKFRVC